MAELKMLDDSKREGNIYVYDIIKTDKVSVSMLSLMPHSRILKHKYIEDNEIYIICENGMWAELCLKGEEHSLDNDNDMILTVISIKYI